MWVARGMDSRRKCWWMPEQSPELSDQPAVQLQSRGSRLRWEENSFRQSHPETQESSEGRGGNWLINRICHLQSARWLQGIFICISFSDHKVCLYFSSEVVKMFEYLGKSAETGWEILSLQSPHGSQWQLCQRPGGRQDLLSPGWFLLSHSQHLLSRVQGGILLEGLHWVLSAGGWARVRVEIKIHGEQYWQWRWRQEHGSYSGWRQEHDSSRGRLCSTTERWNEGKSRKYQKETWRGKSNIPNKNWLYRDHYQSGGETEIEINVILRQVWILVLKFWTYGWKHVLIFNVEACICE